VAYGTGRRYRPLDAVDVLRNEDWDTRRLLGLRDADADADADAEADMVVGGCVGCGGAGAGRGGAGRGGGRHEGEEGDGRRRSRVVEPHTVLYPTG
jgi:hypothetical protein